MSRSVIDYATLTVSSTAVGLADATPAITSAVTGAVITCEDDNIRWRSDGTVPTAEEGHLLLRDGALQFVDGNWREILNKIRFICTSTDAALKITYLRNY